MSSACRFTLIGAALVAACGNYSDTDIPYLEAVPTELAVALPSSSPQTCPHSSELATDAQSAGASINGGIERALGLVDLILATSPTSRTPNGRIWGPFDDRVHPGFEIQIQMAQPDLTQLVYTIEIQERPRNATLVAILDGELHGASPASGSGTLTLHFEALRLLGINNPADPHKPMTVAYDFTGDPPTLSLTLGDAFGALPAFTYQWSGFGDGGATQFDYAWALGHNVLTVDSFFAPTGEGSASVTYEAASGADAGFSECWDNHFCIDYLDDPSDVTGDCGDAGLGPCNLGAPAACFAP